MRRNLLICFFLGAVTIATYWPTRQCDFVNLDDPDYVTANERVLGGLTWKGIGWAFRESHANNWHPLTWVSHMADVECFGRTPGAHHFTNVVFHGANSILLFVLLFQMTGATRRSSIVAGLFALHPLHVESVAWVSERKDVLSTFFGFLTLWAYTLYAQKQKSIAPASSSNSRFTFHVSRFYWLALLFFALGLLSKPMLITWPFVMLLLDYWPLNRIAVAGEQKGTASPATLLLEKLPFLLLAIGSSVVTFVAQQHAMNTFPLSLRIANALVSYVLYLEKMFWPLGLAAYYPYPDSISTFVTVAAALVLLLFSIAAWVVRRKHPYIITGWLWYLGSLVPVIGIVQVGRQAMADRYSYVSLVGIFIAIVWLVEELTRSWRHRRVALGAISVAALTGCAVLTWQQIGTWKNSEALFRNAVAVTRNNAVAHLNLGGALMSTGNHAEAKQHFEEALRIWPDFSDAKGNLGLVLMTLGQVDDAIEVLSRAVEARSNEPKMRYLLGNALDTRGQRDLAMLQLKTALELDPNLGVALNDLAWILATDPDPQRRNGSEAVNLAERACRLTNVKNAQFIGTLAAAYAEANRFDDAVKNADLAREIALAEKNKALADRNGQLSAEYRAGKPHREAATPAPDASATKIPN